MIIATRNQGFGAEVRHRVLAGTFLLSKMSVVFQDSFGCIDLCRSREVYLHALSARSVIREDFSRVFSSGGPSCMHSSRLTEPVGINALLMPMSPVTAPTVHDAARQDALISYAHDVFTVPASLAGSNSFNRADTR